MFSPPLVFRYSPPLPWYTPPPRHHSCVFLLHPPAARSYMYFITRQGGVASPPRTARCRRRRRSVHGGRPVLPARFHITLRRVQRTSTHHCQGRVIDEGESARGGVSHAIAAVSCIPIVHLHAGAGAGGGARRRRLGGTTARRRGGGIAECSIEL